MTHPKVQMSNSFPLSLRDLSLSLPIHFMETINSRIVLHRYGKSQSSNSQRDGDGKGKGNEKLHRKVIVSIWK